MSKTLHYIELFGGIGGFRLGIQNSDLQAQPVDYVEIDKPTHRQGTQSQQQSYKQ